MSRPTTSGASRWRRGPLRRSWPWLRVLLGLAIIALPVWRVGLDAFLDGFRLITGPAVAAAVGIGLLTTVLAAARWCLVARKLGLALPLPTAVADYYRAMFLNGVLPVGILGDADRAVRHGRAAGDLGRGVRAVIFERFTGQLVLLVVAVAALLASPWLLGQVGRHLGPGLAVLVGVVAVGLLVATALWRRRPHRAGLFAATLADARRSLLAGDTWPALLALSVAALSGHLTVFVVAARTAGSSAPIGALLPLLVLALLMMGLPVSVGGFGPREAFAAVAFGAAGLGSALGLTVAVTYGVLIFIASLPGAAMVLLRRGWLQERLGWGTAPGVREEPA